MKEIKTNAMRILDKEKIEYGIFNYECDEFHDGKKTAKVLGLDENVVFKTIVTIGKSRQYYVFVLPVQMVLDLKKCAILVTEKHLELIEISNLLAVTGYVRGGCSPIGMKKKFVTYFDSTIKMHDKIFVSAGKIGVQLKIKTNDLIKITNGLVGELS